MRRRRLSLACLSLCLSLAPRASAQPEVFGLDPAHGPAGTVVTVTGKGLSRTGRVAFAVGRTVKPARFKVVSDRELEVIAPEYYRPEASATLAVFTPAGAAVAMPATGQTIRTSVRGQNPGEPGASFYHVLDGGIVVSAGSVAVIEAGGVVEQGTTPGMQFVKRGGTLVDYENPSGIVFFEPGAVFGPKIRQSRQPLTFIEVPSISVSPGVGPFVYEAPPRPDPGDAPAEPPTIRAIDPIEAPPGGIVTLRGRGLARTTSVQCVEPLGAPRPAGFRIVSDTELRVEVPDEAARPGPQLLMVQGTEGVTVTVPRDRMVRAAFPPRRGGPSPSDQPFYWLGPGDIAEMGGSATIFVEDGGLLTRAGGSCLVFVRRGGRIADRVGASNGLYYEPGAVVPERMKTAGSAQEVPHVVPSFLPHPFLSVPGPVFRR
jgi:hypothetical protein